MSDTRGMSSPRTLPWIAAFVVGIAIPAPAAWAVPGAAIGAGALPKARWISHRVIPGERLARLAAHYGVTTKKIVRWNKLDRERPMIRVNQKLRIYTAMEPLVRERKLHVVERGESWSRIAKHYGVSVRELHRVWNRKAERRLLAGQRLVVWVEPEPAPEPAPDEAAPDATPAETDLPIVRVPPKARSVGLPDRGRLRHGIQLPQNDALYTIRKPENAWGSSHTVMQLQRAIANFRAGTGFDRELVIKDISRRYGGRFRPHRSHRSGRDVDIRLPLAPGLERGTVPERMSDVDWDAAWALTKALWGTGEIRYIFLSRSRQRALYRAARRAGEGEQDLQQLIQFPNRERTAVVRHARGHTGHIHVRFKCAGYEKRCRD